MSNQPLTRNITRIFRLASEDDRAAGHGWYLRARVLAVRLAQENSHLPANPITFEGQQIRKAEIHRAAGVIAALSPRLAWRKNVEYAELAHSLNAQMRSDGEWAKDLTGEFRRNYFVGCIPTLNANAAKAYRILNGELPEDVLGGDKVRAFYFTIVNPSDPRSVVVDRHAVDIAFGEVLTDDTRPIMKGAAYAYVADLYQKAARIISRELDEHWTPAQVQAATWTYWRRERAAAYHGEVA